MRKSNINTDIFIERSELVHGKKYDYSESDYISSRDKIKVICGDHGEFYTYPHNHWKGRGCVYCSGAKRFRSTKHLSLNSDGSVNIELADGSISVIDNDSTHLISKHSWCKNQGYAVSRINNKLVPMHSLLMPSPGNGLEIDHADRDRLNNRRCNLRVCTRSQNVSNGSTGRRIMASRYRGVVFYKGANKWGARAYKNGLSHYMGLFNSEEEAAKAYDAKAKELHGEFANINFK